MSLLNAENLWPRRAKILGCKTWIHRLGSGPNRMSLKRLKLESWRFLADQIYHISLGKITVSCYVTPLRTRKIRFQWSKCQLGLTLLSSNFVASWCCYIFNRLLRFFLWLMILATILANSTRIQVQNKPFSALYGYFNPRQTFGPFISVPN